MNALVNGTERTVPDGSTVADLITELKLDIAGTAVAVNASVVRRGAYAEHALHDGDHVEIIRAVAGG